MKVICFYSVPLDHNDYVLFSTNLMLTPSEARQCATIHIIDDLQIEYPEESFSVALSKADNLPDRVLLSQQITEMVIYDNDRKQLKFYVVRLPRVYADLITIGAELSFTHDIILVDEEAGFVKVCLEIVDRDDPCPVVYPIEFNVSVIEMGAGTYMQYICFQNIYLFLHY